MKHCWHTNSDGTKRNCCWCDEVDCMTFRPRTGHGLYGPSIIWWSKEDEKCSHREA